MWDVFISYASEDRDGIVQPLATRLYERGLTVWMDVTTIRPGDSLVKRIGLGLARSRVAILVISKRYLEKPWPLYELSQIVDGFRGRTYQILAGVTPDELARAVAERLRPRPTLHLQELVDEDAPALLRNVERRDHRSRRCIAVGYPNEHDSLVPESGGGCST